MNNWDGIVSLLVACIELILIINLIVFAEKNKLNKQVILLITLLMIYQIFEFLMCQLNLRYSVKAFLAFANITFLPPVSFIFTLNFLGKKNKLINLILLPGISLIIYYAFIIPEFKVVSCAPLYAAYTYPLGTLYGAVYYLPLLFSAALLIIHLKKKENKKKHFLVKVLLAGHLIVMVPVVIAFILLFLDYPDLLNIIESIMCKFALFYAICLSIFSLRNRNTNE